MTINKQYQIGIMGYGYLGKSLHEALQDTNIQVISIYNRSAASLEGIEGSIATTDIEVFLGSIDKLDLVVELAHPDISLQVGEKILSKTNYMPCSVGALAHDELKDKLIKTAADSGTNLLIPHGAVVGIDNIVEARDNWESVTITFRKPPESIDLEEELTEDETILFEGSVREIADKFPRSVNAMVACALASVGPDIAVGRFIADRRMKGVVRGEFEFVGKDGARLFVAKQEPAVGVSGTGMVTSLKGSVLRALQQSPEGISFV